MRVFLILILITILLAACTGTPNSPDVLPTVADPQAMQTALVKTQNAPPAGFESVAFSPIDYNRDQLPGWYFEVTVNFTGQYTQSSADATSSMKMEVWQNGLQRTRQVKLSFVGEALSGGVTAVEAVRYENDYYLLDGNRVCTKNNPTATQTANLNAADIVGGFTLGLPTGIRGDVNGYPAYQYGFAKENLVINIFNGSPSALEIVGGEVWVLPEFNVVGRFGVSFTVHNGNILFGSQPVTGTLRYEYNLYEISPDAASAPNIAIPNGC